MSTQRLIHLNPFFRKNNVSFNHVDFNLLTTAELIESEGRHHYKTTSGEIYPSITTKLSKTKNYDSINRWKQSVGVGVADHIMKSAMENGTNTHRMIEDFLNNRPSDVNELLPKAHLENLKPLLYNIDNIYFTEVALFSDQLKTAGTCDCVAEYKGNLSIIDFKTSRKRKREEWITDYFLQGTAYAIMWEEMTGIPIDQTVILISGEDGSVEEHIKKTADYTKTLSEKLFLYNAVV